MTAALFRAASVLTAFAIVAACDQKGGDPMKQYGPNPVLPEPRQYLLPQIVYPLLNGDILVVESNGPGTVPYRPKDYIQGKVKARAGAAAKGGNRITLLRDANGDGVPELKTVFIDHFHSPYGIALVGGSLHVANSGAIRAAGTATP